VFHIQDLIGRRSWVDHRGRKHFGLGSGSQNLVKCTGFGPDTDLDLGTDPDPVGTTAAVDNQSATETLDMTVVAVVGETDAFAAESSHLLDDGAVAGADDMVVVAEHSRWHGMPAAAMRLCSGGAVDLLVAEDDTAAVVEYVRSDDNSAAVNSCSEDAAEWPGAEGGIALASADASHSKVAADSSAAEDDIVVGPDSGAGVFEYARAASGCASGFAIGSFVV